LNNHTTLYGLLKRYEISYDKLAGISRAGSPKTISSSNNKLKLKLNMKATSSGNLSREKLKDQEKKKIPSDFDYNSVPGPLQ